VHFYKGEDFVTDRPYDNWLSSYDAVDDAIRSVATAERWVLFTNGDNLYMPEALDFLNPAAADIVGFDMFQRAHPMALTHSARADSCMSNGFKYAGTDLGANVLSLPKLLAEDRRFFSLVKGDRPYSPDDEITPDAGVDGRMIELLVQSGWRTLHIQRCLFSHAPNPWMCKHHGGVWNNHPSRHKARCVSKQELPALSGDLKLVVQAGDLPDYLSWWPVPEVMVRESWHYEDQLGQILSHRGKTAISASSSDTAARPAGYADIARRIFLAPMRSLSSPGPSNVASRCMSFVPDQTGKLIMLPHCDSYNHAAASGFAFDVGHYLQRNPDLAVLGDPPSDAALRKHFLEHGIPEHRCHSWLKLGGDVLDGDKVILFHDFIHPWCSADRSVAKVLTFYELDARKQAERSRHVL
jgi:hypothetical protein